MAYEFKKLGDVEALDEVPENANALIEVDGAIKRVPGSNLGGGGGGGDVPIAIIVRNEANDYYHCENMTFEEVKTLLEADRPVMATISGLNYGDHGVRVSTTVYYSTQTTPLNVIIIYSGEQGFKWESSDVIAMYP